MPAVPVSEGEYRILKAIAEKELKKAELAEASRILGVDESALASIARLLAEKGLLIVKEEVEEKPYLTSEGHKALREGLVEERLVRILAEAGGSLSLAEVRDKLGDEASIAVGQAVKRGIARVEEGRIRLVVGVEEALGAIKPLREALEEASRGRSPGRLLQELRRRGLVGLERQKRIVIEVPGEPKSLLDKVVVEVSRLTAELLRSGEWRKRRFRTYNVRAEPPRILPARIHFLTEFIEELRDIMRELGFREVRGPMVELELFNFDVLFQAQDHPAREIHDTLWIAEPRRGSLEEYDELVERTSRVHERGWGYRWNPEIAARLILRSQTTAVSARVLAAKPEPPIRFFTIGKVFRADTVDATHLADFHQLDGIEGWPGYTFRDLLGTLKEIAERLGLSLKFKPGYFPFTEPSVEGYVRLPNGRWLELFGAGLFRPEVLEITGVDYPVGAWGFGIERLAAAYYGITDIRLLYSRDYDYIRSFPARRW